MDLQIFNSYLSRRTFSILTFIILRKIENINGFIEVSAEIAMTYLQHKFNFTKNLKRFGEIVIA